MKRLRADDSADSRVKVGHRQALPCNAPAPPELGRLSLLHQTSYARYPTQKPPALWDAPMKNHTRRGEVCAEPFAGSGSQFVAGHELGRRVFGMEIHPPYCSVVLQRMADVGVEGQRIAHEG